MHFSKMVWKKFSEREIFAVLNQQFKINDILWHGKWRHIVLLFSAKKIYQYFHFSFIIEKYLNVDQ